MFKWWSPYRKDLYLLILRHGWAEHRLILRKVQESFRLVQSAGLSIRTSDFCWWLRRRFRLGNDMKFRFMHVTALPERFFLIFKEWKLSFLPTHFSTKERFLGKCSTIKTKMRCRTKVKTVSAASKSRRKKELWW